MSIDNKVYVPGVVPETENEVTIDFLLKTDVLYMGENGIESRALYTPAFMRPYLVQEPDPTTVHVMKLTVRGGIIKKRIWYPDKQYKYVVNLENMSKSDIINDLKLMSEWFVTRYGKYYIATSFSNDKSNEDTFNMLMDQTLPNGYVNKDKKNEIYTYNDIMNVIAGAWYKNCSYGQFSEICEETFH